MARGGSRLDCRSPLTANRHPKNAAVVAANRVVRVAKAAHQRPTLAPSKSAVEREPVVAYVALGANLGDARATVLRAMDAIAALPGTQVTQRSPLYRSAPVDSSGPDYINAVLELSTRMSAPVLLEVLQKLEQAAGRERPYRNAPRTLDLDILLFGDAWIHSRWLTIPHPRMHQRAFVLRPLADIAPHRVAGSVLESVRGQCIERLD